MYARRDGCYTIAENQDGAWELVEIRSRAVLVTAPTLAALIPLYDAHIGARSPE